MTRTCPEPLEAHFAQCRATPSDIHEHLDRLRELAETCDHVTEFGLRWGQGSTVAFLAAQPETFISWDVDPRAIVSQPVSDLLGMAGVTRFQPRVGDTREITIEPTDLLFIDTYHSFDQCLAELTRHWKSVRKYLVFHDTVTFGFRGEDGREPGLWTAIRTFGANAFPLWVELEDRPNNNGLYVLARDPAHHPGVHGPGCCEATAEALR